MAATSQFQPLRTRRLPGNTLFLLGNHCMLGAASVQRECLLPEKEDDSVDRDPAPSFRCSQSGCCESFESVAAYADHEKAAHRHVCLVCRCPLPTQHLLDLHLQEEHDPLFQLVSNQQSMYRCLLEACQETFRDPDTRRQHLMKTHLFPPDFRFISKPKAGKKPQTCETRGKANHGQQMSTKSLPTTVRFGQGASKGFVRPRRRPQPRNATSMDVERSDQDESSMDCQELQDALPNDVPPAISLRDVTTQPQS